MSEQEFTLQVLEEACVFDEAMAVGRSSYDVKLPLGYQDEKKSWSTFRVVKKGDEITIRKTKYRVTDFNSGVGKWNDQIGLIGVKGAKYSLTLPKSDNDFAYLLTFTGIGKGPVVGCWMV